MITIKRTQMNEVCCCHFDLILILNIQEHETRFMIFEKNLGKIDLLNRLEQGTAKYGVTRYADLTRK